MAFVRACVKNAVAYIYTMNHNYQNSTDWRLVPHAELVNVSSGSSWELQHVSLHQYHWIMDCIVLSGFVAHGLSIHVYFIFFQEVAGTEVLFLRHCSGSV